MKFAVSNIQLRDGEITIDDQLLGKQHKVEKIQIAVPFIANLPADVDVFVQPLVQMVITAARSELPAWPSRSARRATRWLTSNCIGSTCRNTSALRR